MHGTARRAITILAVCGAVATASGVASAHGPTHQPPTQERQHAVLNGVMDVKKSKLGRFNFRFHVSEYGVVTGHGDYNGGLGKYFSLSSITTFSCSANHLAVTGIGSLNGGDSVPVTITADDGASGNGSADDHFSISFGTYARSGSPIVGKVFLKNCA